MVGKACVLNIEHPKAQKQASTVYIVIMDDNLAPVLLGLSAGIIFIGILALALFTNQIQVPTEFGPLDTQRPMRQFGDAAIMIALQNVTLDKEFSGKDLIVSYYRDMGVGYAIDNAENANGTCPMNHCALVIFADRNEPEVALVSVIVNMDSKQVVYITKVSDLES